jgi:hypothetical protein
MRSDVCAALTYLSHTDLNALLICENNGIFVVASLILPHASQTSEPSVRRLLLNAFRTLRFLFGLPQNRRPFKRLFPPEMFEVFLRAKHYNYDLDAYEACVSALVDVTGSQDASAQFARAVAAADANANATRLVRDYALLEKLGEGAFGSVFRARRSNSSQLCAVKELILGGSCSAEELRANMTSIEHEVSFASVMLMQRFRLHCVA